MRAVSVALLLLVACLGARISVCAADIDFSGTITVAETIAGDQSSNKDQEELSQGHETRIACAKERLAEDHGHRDDRGAFYR